MAIWKLSQLSLCFVLQLGLTAALEAGDCAFVGIYGDKDDFALVLLEDADEQIYLTEELQSTWRKAPVSKFIEGKDNVKDAKRGTVLRREDFVTSEASLVAPLAITAFSGSPSSPSILCSIRLNEKPGAARMLQELNVVSVQSDTATYVGSTSGTKDELLTEIKDSNNWMDAFRKLRGFTVAHDHGNHSETESTSMPSPNTTMTESTTLSLEDDDTTATTTDVSGGPSGPSPPPPNSTTPVPKTDSGNAAASGVSLGFLLVAVSVM